MDHGDDPIVLLIQARHLLGVSQGDLGEMIGSSRRTAQRWETTSTRPDPRHWCEIARRVHPLDPALAAKLAALGGSSLVELGLAAPAAPQADAQGAVASRSGSPAGAPSPEAIDSIVAAAAEALRPAILAAFARAQALGLTVESVVRGLTEKR